MKARPSPASLRILQRVILPVDLDPDVLPLYVEGIDGRGDPVTVEAVAGRRSIIVPPNSRWSLGTYFNAFPASYWQRWTTLEDVHLRIRIAGEVTLDVYRSTSQGDNLPVESVRLDSAKAQDLDFILPLAPFTEGGWYWFDISAGRGGANLKQADWCAITDGGGTGRLSVGILTFNRPEFCVQQLQNLGRAGNVLEALDEIIVIDQGTQRVEDHADFGEIAGWLADRLRVIHQGNLGGSGGFSRAMEQALRPAQSGYLLLFDDDVVVETEGILRALAFAELATSPTIVGGHMFSLHARCVLHAFGETVARRRWLWGPAPDTIQDYDFSEGGLRQTPWLHRRVDVDYNGWWMCLIPVDLIRKVGLALPLFIKWDDAEFGLRSRAAGYPTVSLPGVAVWHVPWHYKADTLGWQAFFHERNRLISGILHSPYKHGGRLVLESFGIVLKHALAMHYVPAELLLMGIQNVLDRPDLHDDLLRRMRDLPALQQGLDAQVQVDRAHLPPRRQKPRRGEDAAAPRGPIGLLATFGLRLLRQLKPVRRLARRQPELMVAQLDQRWWLLSRYDSVLVEFVDGSRMAWYRRDPRRFRLLMRQSLALHARLLHQWPRLQDHYRAAAPELASRERWHATFSAARSTTRTSGLGPSSRGGSRLGSDDDHS